MKQLTIRWNVYLILKDVRDKGAAIYSMRGKVTDQFLSKFYSNSNGSVKQMYKQWCHQKNHFIWSLETLLLHKTLTNLKVSLEMKRNKLYVTLIDAVIS